MITEQQILDKYGDIIKEEINVKKVDIYQSDKPIIKIFKPLGSQLSAKFGKDTGQIIANGKQGNVRETQGGIEVFDNNGSVRMLSENDYEVVYEGLDGNDTTVEGNTIVKLDLEITEDLKREGVAREISRFLNQMRKDANLSVDARIYLHYQTENNDMKAIIDEFGSFLKDEALILEINSESGDNDIYTAIFESDGKKITFGITKVL